MYMEMWTWLCNWEVGRGWKTLEEKAREGCIVNRIFWVILARSNKAKPRLVPGGNEDPL